MKTLKFHCPAGAIVLTVTRDGHDYYFFLDTGCPMSFAEIPALEGQIRGTDFADDLDVVLALAPPPFSLTPISEKLCIPLSGLLGMDFISRFRDVVIDYANKTISFNQGAFVADIELPLLHEGPAANPTPLMTPGGGLKYPVSELSLETTPYLRSCVLDTGATTGVICNQNPLKGHYETSPGWTGHTPAGPITFTLYKGVSTYLPNGEVLEDSVYVFSPHYAQSPWDLIIGANILSRYDCCFDIQNLKVRLKRNIAGPFPATVMEDRYTTGFEVVLRNRRLVVSNLVEWTPNHGIKEGDQLEIDGLDLNCPEIINTIIDILSPNHETIIKVTVNGRATELRTAKLFKSWAQPVGLLDVSGPGLLRPS